MKILHVLGADIPHHNATVLRFFSEVLLPLCPNEQVTHFLVVSQHPLQYPGLLIECYPSKWALAQAVIRQARTEKQSRFFFHGQFNPWLWLALAGRIIAPQQAYWHIWGADLYEDSAQLKFKLFYRLRRLAQRRIGHVFATLGDLSYYRQQCPTVVTSLLYFPTRIEPISPPQTSLRESQQPLTILIGNSGDKSNRHLAALESVVEQFGTEVNLVIPLGYPANNQSYIAEIKAAAQQWFAPERIRLLTDRIEFSEYIAILRQCDLGYFLFERQQGIGTLCLLIQLGIPVVLSQQNNFCQDLSAQHIPYWLVGVSLSDLQLLQLRQELGRLDIQSIAFFPPNYFAGWLKALSIVSEQHGVK